MAAIIEMGRNAPNFSLPDLAGKRVSLNELAGRIVVLYFWSAECVWCERVDQELERATSVWGEALVALWIASNANETNELISMAATERDLPIVLLDREQVAADLYGAETTPHFFIINAKGELAYQGAWDDITFRQRTATQVYVPAVVEALIAGREPPFKQTQPYGCVLVRYSE